MALTGNNAITLRKLTSKVTAEKGAPLSRTAVLIEKQYTLWVAGVKKLRVHVTQCPSSIMSKQSNVGCHGINSMTLI